MRPALYRSSSDRRRGSALTLTIVAHILILLLLLRLNPDPPPPKEPEPPVFDLAPEAGAVPKPQAKAAAKKASGKAAPQSPAPRTAAVAAPPVPVPTPAPPDLMHMSKEAFAATDIASLPHADDGGDAGSGDGKDSASVYGPGEGPGGQRLYNAEWYVEPTNAQLSFYLPANVPRGSWGMVACQTIARFHVDNCRALGESPVGSGIARGMRLAAWQFLVRPPRIGGKAMIGAWVRIRIDFTEQGEARAAGRR